MLLIAVFLAVPAISFPSSEPQQQPAPQAQEDSPLSAAELFAAGVQQMKDGDCRGAILSLSQAHKKNPRLTAVKKAWAKALITLAAQQRKLGNVAGERYYYTQAVDVDETLADDPEYVLGYKTVNLPMAGSDGKAFSELKMPRLPSRQNKYLGLHLGAGLYAPLGVGVQTLIVEHLELSVSFDTIYAGIAVEARAIILKSSWSPYAGVGGRFAFFPDPLGPITAAHYFFLDIGVEYAHASGFFIDIGIAWSPPRTRSSPMNDVFYPLPKLTLGWNFGW